MPPSTTPDRLDLDLVWHCQDLLGDLLVNGDPLDGDDWALAQILRWVLRQHGQEAK